MSVYPNIQPDWTQIWTVQQAEKQLAAFKFKGPGWYIGKDDVLLVSPEGVEVTQLPSGRWIQWVSQWPPNQLFSFCVFNGRATTLFNSFNCIMNAPVREDNRE